MLNITDTSNTALDYCIVAAVVASADLSINNALNIIGACLTRLKSF